jgi:NADH-quinone oxidoreductase subunit J
LTNVVFYIAAAVTVISTVMVITRLNAVHALLYLIVSLQAMALIFYLLGAPFAAALEIIVYAGAIMILFIFVIMMLNLGPPAMAKERQLLEPGMWIGPSILAAVLMAQLIWIFAGRNVGVSGTAEITPKEVGLAMYGPYVLGVELASMLLLAGLVGAFHLARKERAR